MIDGDSIMVQFYFFLVTIIMVQFSLTILYQNEDKSKY